MIGIIGAALAAVGLGSDPLDSDSFAERSAHATELAATAKATAERRQQEAAATERNHLANELVAAKAVAQKLAATRARLEASIASDLQSAIAEVWPAFVEQPSRLTTAAFVEPIAMAARKASECLNEEIAIAALFVAFASPFVAASPGLASVLNPLMYPHLGDAAGNVLRLVVSNAHTSHLQAALEHLEALLATAKPSTPNPIAIDEFEVLKSVTTRTGMLAAVEAHQANVSEAAKQALPRTAGPASVVVPGIRNVSATANP